jgi:hypothetical protein
MQNEELHNIYFKDEMAGICSMHGEMRNADKIIAGKTGRNYLRGLGMGVRIILERIFEK